MSSKLGELSVGSSVYLNVNGVKTEFLVVHQGLPSSDYDNSCDGTWLMMEALYESRVWHSSLSNSYSASSIHSYLNSTFFNLLDSDINSAVKTVKLPYTNGTGADGSVASGSSGLSAKVFLLSYAEVGFSGDTNVHVEGAVLSYFNGAADSKRVAKLNGSAARWWLRSPNTVSNFLKNRIAWCAQPDGSSIADNVTKSNGVRPALVLPSSLSVSGDGTIVVATIGIQGNVTVNGVRKDLTGESYVNINGVWKEVVKSYANINGIWKPTCET